MNIIMNIKMFLNIKMNIKIISNIISLISFQAQKTRAITHKLTNLIRFTEMREEVR